MKRGRDLAIVELSQIQPGDLGPDMAAERAQGEAAGKRHGAPCHRMRPLFQGRPPAPARPVRQRRTPPATNPANDEWIAGAGALP